MEARKKLGQVRHGIILAKASLLYNWRDEIHMHTHEKAIVVAGPQKRRYRMYSELTLRTNRDDWTFLIISYETFRSDIENLALLNQSVNIDFMVLDEAHKIKNPRSKAGMSIHRLDPRYRYVLTATPLPNSPLEAYNYLKFGEKIRMNPWQFERRYAIFGGYNNKQIVGYQNIRELQTLIQDNMLRRLKKDKLKELPDITSRRITIEMTPAQTKLYNAVKMEILEDLKDTELTKIPTTLAKLLRLQQITDTPALIGSDAPSSKLEALDDLLESLVDVGGQKVIVFSRFKEMVKILEQRYAHYNPAVITGDVDASGKSEQTVRRKIRHVLEGLSLEEQQRIVDQYTASERQKEVVKFQNDDTCRIFIGCAPACREGLTLTAATHVVFVDCEWSPAYVEQAYSRAHRIGQKNAVTIHYIICAGTIDEYVQETLERKSSMAQTMLDKMGQGVKADSARETILSLIGGMRSA